MLLYISAYHGFAVEKWPIIGGQNGVVPDSDSNLDEIWQSKYDQSADLAETDYYPPSLATNEDPICNEQNKRVACDYPPPLPARPLYLHEHALLLDRVPESQVRQAPARVPVVPGHPLAECPDDIGPHAHSNVLRGREKQSRRFPPIAICQHDETAYQTVLTLAKHVPQCLGGSNCPTRPLPASCLRAPPRQPSPLPLAPRVTPGLRSKPGAETYLAQSK